MMNHHRLLKLTRNICLIRRAKIPAPFKLRLHQSLLEALVKHLYSIIVMYTRKWRHYGLEFRSVALQNFQLFLPVFDYASRNVSEHALCEAKDIIESRV